MCSVSVILPCFNAARTLGAAVESICAQSFEDWELILFDDGSTDASLDVARELAAGDGRLRVIESEHVGIVEALRRGCEMARGRYLARMDADDISLPERLKRQVWLMEQEPDIALCGTQVVTGGANIGSGRLRYDAWLNGLVCHEDMVRELFVECPVAHPTFMLRTSDYIEAGGYEDHGWAEDYDLCMRLFMMGKGFGKVAMPLLEWHESDGRLSRADGRYSSERFRALKRHYLLKTYLADKERRASFIQWGAGEVGKPWLRECGSDARPVAVVDINPRKIGRMIHGTKVIAPEELPEAGKAFIVIAVGAPGARDEIRQWLGEHGHKELRDYLFLA